ncbi:transaldolase [Austwickia chelonae]|uniref:Transaldolase n=1 Tax=Austwickia chelonae NBRC 105200 TaxID=1184607 RepID=K6VKE8_9MICO|nr:transaldolase [Austwickia chelonae]GAB77199.1 transaldolase [Austwickia chelonae NBRC 105200]SEW04980.1 transaldolase [Austwickia chelonae]
MTQNPRLERLAGEGVSVWLDDLNRAMITSGELASLVDDQGVVGVTTNPTIFAGALRDGDAYASQLVELAGEGVGVDEAVLVITTDDVRQACDALRPVYDRTQGQDGRVSIEVDPRLARDTAATVDMARRLWSVVDRPNVMIKVPATVEGLPAISTLIAEGIDVNVTLIFSLDRYRAVMNAYLTGLEQARQAGRPLDRIHSVASFFISRVDSDIDARLDELGSSEAAALRGRAGIGNACLAYQAYAETFSTPRWANLADDGARPQRPLWASTGVKDPSYPDTMYVTGLVAPGTVNTMPRATLAAVADHAEILGDVMTDSVESAATVLDDLERLGISYTEVVEKLETEGLVKFEDSWSELLSSVESELRKVRD